MSGSKVEDNYVGLVLSMLVPSPIIYYRRMPSSSFWHRLANLWLGPVSRLKVEENNVGLVLSMLVLIAFSERFEIR